jgi:hypothetical protein
MNIDWSSAPAWANFHACDADGSGRWFENPFPVLREWYPYRWSKSKRSGFVLTPGEDWKQSKVERPKAIIA